jgi:hypothetical protein
MIFEQPRWPLHTALAWVITRDLHFTEKSKPDDFWPYVPRDEHEPLSEDREAWRLLFDKMKDGSILVFGRRWGEPEAEQQTILPEELEGLDWGAHGTMPALRERAASQDEDEHLSIDAAIRFVDVVVSSGTMICNFLSGSEPIAFSTRHIGSPEKPDGPDYMALSAAAYWIATKGGTFEFFGRDEDVWRDAYRELLAQIVGGHVKVIGRREKDNPPEAIEGLRFSGIEIDYPYPSDDDEASINLMLGDRPFLRCGSPVTPADWQLHNDSLRGGRSAPKLTHLQVSKTDVARLWSFDASSGQLTSATIAQPKPGPIEKIAVDDKYKVWVAEHRPGTRSPSIDDDWKHMKKSFADIPRSRVEELRRAHAPLEWRKSGRRRAE